MRARLNLFVVLATASSIAFFSVLPVPARYSGASPYDLSALLHFVAYFALAAALLLYSHDTQKGHLEAVLVAASFGLLLEFVQLSLQTRTFSMIDIAANTFGAALVLLDHQSTQITKIVQVEDRLIEKYLV